ncbi:hypothetical protein BDZ45DRAFT_692267 [Acephala macrosclerotiorum]|nr:hypothetical protein BDZ45DRAFT_692267 [Acephala macrosclerotiorum]
MAQAGDGVNDDLALVHPPPYPASSTSVRRCEICTEGFVLDIHLEEHFQIDHPECPHCRAKKQDQEELCRHIRSRHPSCDRCQKAFRTPAQLEQHRNVQLLCSACSIDPFCTQSLLERHKQESHKECDDCGIWVFDMDAFTEHKDDAHPTCVSCQKRFDTRALYDQHGYWCEVCPTETWFCTRAQLSDHQKAEHKKCSRCEKLFENNERLRVHKDKVHGPRCPACPHRFPRGLAIHFVAKPSHKPPPRLR